MLRFPIQLELPSKSVSVNHLYGKSKFGVYLKREGKEEWIKLTKVICDTLDISYSIKPAKGKALEVITPEHTDEQITNKRYSVEYKFYSRWLTLKGENLKSDVSNRVKLVEDIISKSINIDDRCFWDTRIIKIHEPNPENYKIKVIINQLD
jgi:hypothetical protein